MVSAIKIIQMWRSIRHRINHELDGDMDVIKCSCGWSFSHPRHPEWKFFPGYCYTGQEILRHLSLVGVLLTEDSKVSKNWQYIKEEARIVGIVTGEAR